ncbi:hypothetical protein GSI_11321 [Ganoderma sinense ZZ0214-1]|uniref:Uncharacterized protein n=1 Tax=Ganoderma sinense ZZ0214-1 TaxID=1077348 RepID=A0A2G8RVN2_9APHY|nr:hypothetical protein GSI_11321 [Ganoderma sinense ZZ0214-1]
MAPPSVLSPVGLGALTVANIESESHSSITSDNSSPAAAATGAQHSRRTNSRPSSSSLNPSIPSAAPLPTCGFAASTSASATASASADTVLRRLGRRVPLVPVWEVKWVRLPVVPTRLDIPPSILFSEAEVERSGRGAERVGARGLAPIMSNRREVDRTSLLAGSSDVHDAWEAGASAEVGE